MDLGKHVIDKELIDRHGWRAGRVDDLLLEVPEPVPDNPAPLPEVRAIVTGPLALCCYLPGTVEWLVRRLYRLLGVNDPHPVEIPWSRVTAIDVTVHVDVDREEAGLLETEHAVERLIIGRLPGA